MKAMSSEVRKQFLRRIVMWCAMDGRPLSAVHGFAFKMLIGFLNPAAVAPMPSPASLTSTLDSMYQEAKARAIHKLKARRDAFSLVGYREAFCSLRLDMTTVASTEYITISTSFIGHDSGDLEILTLITRAFRGTHKEADIVRVIKEVTTEYFSFVPDVQPRDVFVAATVDRGGNVMNACKSLGLPTLLCRAHRLNSCVIWALGVAGSQRRCKHPSMKKLLGKLGALVEIFSHSAVNNDALRAIHKECNEQERGALMELQAAAEQEREAGDEVDDDEGEDGETFTTTPSRVGKQKRGIFNPTRRNDIRWGSEFDCMSRAIVLEDTIASYLQRHPQHSGRGLSPSEWSTIKEVCSILDPLRLVNVAIQGGRGGRLSQTIFMCHELREVLKLDSLDMIEWKTFCDPGKATVGSTCERLISSLASDSRKVRDVTFTELEERGLASADLDVEVVALYLDPRYSKLDKSICANGDNDGEMVRRAREELFRIAAKMSLDDDRASSPQIASGDSCSAAGYPKALSIFERRQIQREKDAQARALKISMKDQIEDEMRDYERHPAVVSREFNLLLWWRDAAMPKLDANGNILNRAKFPLLASMANIFHCIHSTSCRSERDLSALALTLTNLRQSSLPEEVQKIMFLRLNPLLLPDVADKNDCLAERQKVEAAGRAYAKATQAALTSFQVV